MDTNTENQANQNALAAIDRGLSLIEPSLWVVNRQRTLKAEACTMRAGINVSKTLSLSSAVVAGGVGLLMGATGVALVGGGLGLLAYGAVMVCDVLDTGRFAPVPFVRTGLGDRLELMGNADAREQRAEFEAARAAAGARDIAADEELYSNLPEELSKEAMMLLKHSRLVVSLLAQLPPASRDLAYIHMCTMFNAFGDSLTGLSLQRLNDAIAGRIGGNYSVMRPAEIHDYQPPAYQLGSAQQNFGELPAAMPVGELQAAASTPNTSAYALITASPYRSRLFLGGQRTGKSYLAFNSAARAAMDAGADIFYVNLAAWESEDDNYSSVAVMSAAANIQAMDSEQTAKVIEQAMKVLEAFSNSSKPAILLFEEWCETSSINHKHRELLKPLMIQAASAVEQLANTGMKRRKAIYATAPQFVAGSLTQAAKAAKSMELVLVAIAPGRTVYWQKQAITFSPAVFSQAAANWHGVVEPAGGVDSERIALCEGVWMPVGDMPAVTAQTAKTAPTVPAAAVAVADEFKADEVTPTAKPSGTIPGLSKTLPEAADMVARFLQKNEGTDHSMGAIAKVFRSDDRDAIRPLLQSICLTLVHAQPGNYIYKCGTDGKAKICYQSDPIVTKWTGDEA